MKRLRLLFAASQQNLLAVIILPKQNHFERLPNVIKKRKPLSAANVMVVLRKSINMDDSTIGWTAGTHFVDNTTHQYHQQQHDPARPPFAAASNKAYDMPLKANYLRL